MRTRVLHRIVPFALFALVAAGCSSSWVDTDLRLNDSSPAATVDGIEIPRSQVDTHVRDILQAAPGAIDDMSADERARLVEPLQRRVLSTMIQSVVIEQLADARGIEIDVEEIQAEVDRQIEERGEAAFSQALAMNDLSIELVRTVLLPAQFRVNELTALLLADKPDVELRSVRHILVETEAEAETVLDELADGADFATLAQERSLDTGSGAAGGELGPSPEGSFVPEFDEAVWESSIGTLVGPIETQFGFHVLEVLEEETSAAVDLPDNHAQSLVGEELNALIGEAFGAADVTVAPGLGEWDPEAGRVVAIEPVGDAEAPAEGAEPQGSGSSQG